VTAAPSHSFECEMVAEAIRLRHDTNRGPGSVRWRNSRPFPGDAAGKDSRALVLKTRV
jgi:hypothetical protein